MDHGYLQKRREREEKQKGKQNGKDRKKLVTGGIRKKTEKVKMETEEKERTERMKRKKMKKGVLM
jgi:hypothetical protein